MNFQFLIALFVTAMTFGRFNRLDERRHREAALSVTAEETAGYTAQGLTQFDRLANKLIAVSGLVRQEPNGDEFQAAIRHALVDNGHNFVRPPVRFISSMEVNLMANPNHRLPLPNQLNLNWSPLNIDQYHGLVLSTAADMDNAQHNHNMIGVIYEAHSPEMRHIIESIADRIITDTAGEDRANMINFLIHALNPDGVLMTLNAEAEIRHIVRPVVAPAPVVAAVY